MSRIIRLDEDNYAGLRRKHAIPRRTDEPEEATLPTILWCATHECCAGPLRHPENYSTFDCRVVRVPLPVHLGVEDKA